MDEQITYSCFRDADGSYSIRGTRGALSFDVPIPSFKNNFTQWLSIIDAAEILNNFFGYQRDYDQVAEMTDKPSDRR
jgi:hypothetical protein